MGEFPAGIFEQNLPVNRECGGEQIQRCDTKENGDALATVKEESSFPWREEIEPVHESDEDHKQHGRGDK
jgi:hypothetical protein